MHYKPNRLSRSAFWDFCRNEQPLGDAQEILDFYQAVGPDFRALQPRLRSDSFGAEGYLAILVGQQVPHRGQNTMTTAEVDAWNEWRQLCSRRAERGVNMADYLSRIRQGRLRLRFSPSN